MSVHHDSGKLVETTTIPPVESDPTTIAVPKRKRKPLSGNYTGSFMCTDAGNAELITQLYGKVLRYDHAQHRWLAWDRHRLRWNVDAMRLIRQLAINAARHRRENLAPRIEDKEDAKREFKWACDSENRNKLDAAVDLARSMSPIADSGSRWDADAWLFGVDNGVIDLKTGVLRKEQPEDRITKHSPVQYDASAECPRFKQFLNEIFQDDAQLIGYVQRKIGYFLTGSVSEQALFNWYGGGSNGKTTFVLLLRYIFGPYAVDLLFSALESKNRNSNDLATLAGARLATAVETNEGMRLNEARIKALTGGDPITARKLYCEPFTFDPSHKLVLAFNHKPVIADDSEGMWRRVHLVPFNRHFTNEEKDTELLEKLKAEAPGILAWAVQGCLLWQKHGLGMPPAVKDATAEYRDESDHVGEFIADCCVLEQSTTVVSKELWQRYQRWVEDNEEVQLKRNAFGERLARRGLVADRSAASRGWKGIRLKEPTSAAVPGSSFIHTAPAAL